MPWVEEEEKEKLSHKQLKKASSTKKNAKQTNIGNFFTKSSKNTPNNNGKQSAVSQQPESQQSMTPQVTEIDLEEELQMLSSVRNVAKVVDFDWTYKDQFAKNQTQQLTGVQAILINPNWA